MTSQGLWARLRQLYAKAALELQHWDRLHVRLRVSNHVVDRNTYPCFRVFCRGHIRSNVVGLVTQASASSQLATCINVFQRLPVRISLRGHPKASCMPDVCAAIPLTKAGFKAGTARLEQLPRFAFARELPAVAIRQAAGQLGGPPIQPCTDPVRPLKSFQDLLHLQVRCTRYADLPDLPAQGRL